MENLEEPSTTGDCRLILLIHSPRNSVAHSDNVARNHSTGLLFRGDI